MPSPSTALTTLRPDLGSYQEFDYEANRLGAIGSRVLARAEVAKQAGPFGKVKLDQLLKNAEDLRNSDGSYNRSSWEFTTDSFATVDRGIEERVDDRDARRYAEFFDLEQIAAARARDLILRNYEKRVAAAVFNTTTWTGASLTTAIGTNWNVYTAGSNGTPITDIKSAMIKVRENCGMLANTVIMDWELFRHVIQNPEVTDLLKYNGIVDVRPGQVTAQALAQILGVAKVLVAGMVKNTAIEGQSATLAAIWDKTMCMVCVTAEDNGPIEDVSIGRTMHWSEDGSDMGGFVESYRDDHRRGDWVRCRMEVQEKIIHPQAGHLLTAVL